MESTKVYIGIDPGLTGAIVKMYPNGSIGISAFPLIGGSDYDLLKMREMFRYLQGIDCHVCIEDVKALQRPYDRGNWKLSRGKAFLEAFCACYNIPYTLVGAKTWQKEMWRGVPEKRKPSTKVTKKDGSSYMKKGSVLTKEMSLLAVNRLFPDVDLRDPNRKTDRATKPHEGVVDALLIAEYGRRARL